MTSLPIHAGPPSYYDQSSSHPVEPIALSISGTLFITTIPTLTSRSHYFLTLFCNPHWKSTLQPDNALFVDSDPTVFTHILNYLRRGVFPLAYDQKRGHDYKLYADILADAQYFQIPKLEAWITERLYIHCVTISTEWRPGPDPGNGSATGISSTWTGDAIHTKLELVEDEVTTTRSMICGHLVGKRNTCPSGKTICAVGGGTKTDDSERYRWAEVGRRVAFHHGWCSDMGANFAAWWEARVSPSAARKS
ncbi:hypothetical protein B0T14DRAFT_569132 [Immersiella caudata]|uniref:BTB domain-containing protein n=1 Tax=Immersiella caudata TaxID=314043 RepID=A0AA39WLJ2_9PEZI|nr:hypothetical protein B0T14DRAFT_569132 [Immersiella caudata]